MARDNQPQFCSLCGMQLRTWARPTFSAETGSPEGEAVFYAKCQKGHEKWQADEDGRWHRFEGVPPETAYEVGA